MTEDLSKYFEDAESEGKSKPNIELKGPSGSGKTRGALRIAKGLVDDMSKIVVIDTERGTSKNYKDLGNFKIMRFEPPYHPNRYINAIAICEKAGFEVVIIDSMTHEWSGTGGILELKENMTGNDFAKWKTLTPLHNKFMEAVLNSNCYMICTTRKKQSYELDKGDDGKLKIQKVGLKDEQRDSVEYEFDIAFDINEIHRSIATKDRTGIFMEYDKKGEPIIQTPFLLTEETGNQIKIWANT